MAFSKVQVANSHDVLWSANSKTGLENRNVFSSHLFVFVEIFSVIITHLS